MSVMDHRVNTAVKSIPRPEKISEADFRPAAQELFDRIMQMSDNAGATDEHRALNYLAVRYHSVYPMQPRPSGAMPP
jgi:PatG C-terminal